jgi:hypothetical protein
MMCQLFSGCCKTSLLQLILTEGALSYLHLGYMRKVSLHFSLGIFLLLSVA